jgi:anthranilate synthase component II
MKLLVLDNYDSFVYNLVHIIRELGYGDNMDVIRNDKISLDEVAQYDKILLSPGPGIPVEAGIMMDLIKTYAPTKSIFGVCLGHQAIGESFGATLTNMNDVLHGFGTPTKVLVSDVLFEHVPETFITGRYHSWVVDRKGFPDALEITAVSEDDYIMALRHKTYDVRGVQFHPESILTEHGIQLVKNWLTSKH